MNWLALTVVTFVCFALVLWIKQRQYNHPALQFPYRLRPTLLDETQRELLALLQRQLGERYLVLPGMPLADLVEITVVPRRTPWYQARNRIAERRMDFLLLRRPDLVPAGGVMLEPPQDPFLEQLFNVLELPLVRLDRGQAHAYGQVSQALADAGLH